MTDPTPPPLDLDTIRARIGGTTPGPWETRAGWIITPDDTVRLADVMDYEADAEIIAHAREDVPALVAEVEALRARITTAQDALKGPRAGDNVMRAWDRAIIRARKALAGDAT